MARSVMWLILGPPALWMCGCGTLISTKAPYNKLYSTYGGVQVDARMCAATAPSVLSLLCIADLPVSAVADTLLLPVTLNKTKDTPAVKGQAGQDQASQKSVIPPAPPQSPERQVGWVGLPASMTTSGGGPSGP